MSKETTHAFYETDFNIDDKLHTILVLLPIDSVTEVGNDDIGNNLMNMMFFSSVRQNGPIEGFGVDGPKAMYAEYTPETFQAENAAAPRGFITVFSIEEFRTKLAEITGVPTADIH